MPGTTRFSFIDLLVKGAQGECILTNGTAMLLLRLLNFPQRP